MTLVIRTVAGLVGRFGSSTARRFECPLDWLVKALAKAIPTGPVFEPIKRSMWATSLPSPTRASPTYIVCSPAIAEVSEEVASSAEGASRTDRNPVITGRRAARKARPNDPCPHDNSRPSVRKPSPEPLIGGITPPRFAGFSRVWIRPVVKKGVGMVRN